MFEILNKAYKETFLEQNNFKILRCTQMLEDVESEEILAKRIEEEHKSKNHRGIEVIFKELKEKLYHPNLKIKLHNSSIIVKSAL
jgi:hypothetical protein